jgi:hypothetical protein
MMAAMPPAKRSPPSVRKLIGDLSVDDARHLLHTEGGELTSTEIAFRLISTAAVSVLTARAIVVGHANVWHLALPMVAQYFAIILSVPVVYLATPHPELRINAVKCLRLWIGFAAAAILAMGVRSWTVEIPWREQVASDAARAWAWIYGAEMHWPILLAFCGEAAAMPGRVRNLVEHGPPFVSINLGCAMRFVVLMFGCVLLPWAFGSSERMTWFLCALIMVAELMALWMHWDIQQALRKLDDQTPESSETIEPHRGRP